MRAGAEADLLLLPRGVERCEIHGIGVRPLQKSLDVRPLGPRDGEGHERPEHGLVGGVSLRQPLGDGLQDVGRLRQMLARLWKRLGGQELQEERQEVRQFRMRGIEAAVS